MIKGQKKFSINTITFESGDNEVLLRGNIIEGVLNYASELIVSFSQLNTILNTLRSNNTNFSIDQYLKEEKMYDSQSMFEANISSISNNAIALNQLRSLSEFKQIRA